MPRGGKREGAGRRSSWASGCRFEETKLIRVPKAIADQVLQYAHDVDAHQLLKLNTKSESSTQLAFVESPARTVITPHTRLSGVELGSRLGVSSAALTPVLKRGIVAFAQYTRERDPEGIAWERDGKRYKPQMVPL